MFDFDLENIKDSLDRINLESLLPDLSNFASSVLTFTRWAMLLGPLVILVLGVLYLIAAPKEANYTIGYRCFFGMGSVQAWRFTQRLAGIGFAGLGLVLGIIAVLRSGTIAALPADRMVWYAARLLLWQAGLALVLNVGIWLTTFFVFDSKGELRNKPKK